MLQTTRRSALAGSICLAPQILWPPKAEAKDPFTFFPGAKFSAEVDDAVKGALETRGYNQANTLFAHSV